MGTIVLTVKRSNLKKLHCKKQHKGLFFEKIFPRFQVQIHRGNFHEIAFTPIKFEKQSYLGKAYH